MIRTIFELTGPDGLTRRGVLTRPAGGQRIDTAIVLLPAGLKYHVGPSRLNVLLARTLARAGYASLCIDPVGLGESDGSLGPGPVREIWRSVEQGRFVEDTLLAVRELRARLGLNAVVVGGLCGGAVTAMLAAARSPRLVDGVISLNTAVTLTPIEAGARKAVGAVQARHHIKSYLKKLAAPSAWARIVRRESDFRGIRATVWAALRSGRPTRGRDVTHPNENPAFVDSFRRLEHGRVPHLLLFSGNDNRWLEFQEIVLHRYLGGKLAGDAYRIEIVQQANHELHWKQWQDQALAAVCEWVQREFPESARHSRATA